MIPTVERAISIVSAQTTRLRRKLRKNRNRIVYRIEADNELCRNVYSLYKALLLALKYSNAYIWQGEQNARWICSDNLTGIRWNKRRQWSVIKS